ncbi:unnamed protein product [Ectocarpus sp. CCAP 1310/34]|nr:unnamed protein product [Ectocarpus sp. CCAP 1310/34]
MEDGDLESDEERHARGSSTETTTTRGSSRSKYSGTAGSSSRQTSAESGGGMVSTDVEEVVKREIESATGSRLAQVEGALRELSRKQAELESREKQLDEANGTSSAGALALVTNAATTSGASSSVATGAEAGGLVVSQGGGTAGAEWVEYWDESAGASYFFNTVTQEASWTNPNEGTESRVAGGAIVASEAGSGGAGGEGGRAAGPETLSQHEDGRAKWTECLDEASGSTYYYNVITGEAVWEKPAELSNMKGAVGGVPQFDRPEDWVCYLDETSGEEYWFNLTTGETHWGSA